MFHGNIAAALTGSRRLRRQSEAREEEQVRNSFAITLDVGIGEGCNGEERRHGGNKWILLKPRLLATVTREDGL